MSSGLGDDKIGTESLQLDMEFEDVGLSSRGSLGKILFSCIMGDRGATFEITEGHL